MKWYLMALQKYAQFEGRSRRKEYWMFFLFNMIFTAIAAVMDNLLGIAWESTGYGPLYGVYALAMLVPNIALTARRLHDVGKSGWFMFIGIIPIIGSIWLLVLLATDGVVGPNEYGQNPKDGNEFGNDSLDGHLM